MFAILSVISCPELIINVYGTTVSTGLSVFATTTVGNLVSNVINNTVTIAMPGCDANLFGEDNCVLNRTSVGTFYMSIDLAVCVFILVAFLWLRYFEKEEEKTLDKNTIYASMYTVAVRNLPKTGNELQLTDHFNNILGGQFPIVSVHIGHAMNKEIEKCGERGNLIRKKSHLIHEHRYHCTKTRTQGGLKKDVDMKIKKLRVEFLRELKQLDLKIKEFDRVLKSLAANESDPLVAYVTFEESMGANIIRDLFTPSLFGWFFYDKRLLMKGNKLSVKTAPEPSGIIWENLEFNAIQRFSRRGLTFFLALILVLVSVAITYGAKLVEISTTKSGGLAPCPAGFTDQGNSAQLLIVDMDNDLLHCYCDQFSYYKQANDDTCKTYFNNKLRGECLSYFSSVVVLAVSTLIELGLRTFAEFERHHSEDGKEESVFVRLFFLQYLNTSCVFLINNYPQVLELFYHSGSTSVNQFTMEWYNSVGVTVILVQLGNILFSQSTPLYEYFMYHAQLKAAEKKETLAITQAELNKIHVGPKFELAFRYAQLMSTFFVCLTFCSGMPILFFLGTLNFLVSFLVDKYLFVNMYSIPHRYSAIIGKKATMLIPLGVALHLVMSIWVLSNEQIFSSTPYSHAIDITRNFESYILVQGLSEMISYQQTFPVFLLFASVLLFFLLHKIFNQLKMIILQLRMLFVGDKEAKEKIQALQALRRYGVTVPFSRAVQRNIIKGLSTYNVLQNPVYKEKFAITWVFAFRHNDVRSVLFHAPRQVQDMDGDEDDDDVVKVDRMSRREAREVQVMASLSRGNEAGLIGLVPKSFHEHASRVAQGHGDRGNARGRDAYGSSGGGGGYGARGQQRLDLSRIDSTMKRQALMFGELSNVDGDDIDDNDIENAKEKNSSSTRIDDNNVDFVNDFDLDDWNSSFFF